MDLHGSLAENLQAAVNSAKRHRDHPVHTDTVKFWADLLHYARSLRAAGHDEASAVDPLLAELDLAVAKRCLP
jgi:hypothetical protein